MFDGGDICNDITFKWISLVLPDDESILVPVMPFCIIQQAITRANVDPVLCHHMVSLGHNELTYLQVQVQVGFIHSSIHSFIHLLILWFIHLFHWYIDWSIDTSVKWSINWLETHKTISTPSGLIIMAAILQTTFSMHFLKYIFILWSAFQGIPLSINQYSGLPNGLAPHDDVIKWKHFPRYWPFVREIHRSPVNFPHKGQWRGALMFSLMYAWINDCVNNREAGDLRLQHGHYDVIVMQQMTNHYLKQWWPSSLTHLLRDKMAAISQAIFSDAFSWMKRFVFCLKFPWWLFLRVQLKRTKQWFR